MKNEKKPASARVMAARTILDQATKGAELLDLAGRVERLERLLEMKGGT